MKNYLCVFAYDSSDNAAVSCVIDVQNQAVVASVSGLSNTALNDAGDALDTQLRALYASPQYLEAPYQQVGVTAAYNPLFLLTTMGTQSGSADSTLIASLIELTSAGATTLASSTLTFTTPTTLTNQAMLMGSDSEFVHVLLPSADGTAQRVLSLGIDGTATEAPCPTGYSIVAGVLNDGSNSYLAFGQYNGSDTNSQVWTKGADEWTRTVLDTTDTWTTPHFPATIPAAMATSAGLSPRYYSGRYTAPTSGARTGSTDAQGYDANGSYRIVTPTPTVYDNATDAALFNVLTLLQAAGFSVDNTDNYMQHFVYMNEFAVTFWKNLVDCEEVIA